VVEGLDGEGGRRLVADARDLIEGQLPREDDARRAEVGFIRNNP
jgi:hypothetical protein